MLLPLLICVVSVGVSVVQGYQVPQATVQALKPRGLRVSIPDESGVQLFAVNANVNKPITKPTVGQISGETTRSKDRHWVVEVPQARLKVGDTINYWIYVQANGEQFYGENLISRVTELVDPKKPVSPVDPTKPTCQSTVTTVNGQSSCKGKLIFEETFDSLSSDKWKHDVLLADAPEYEFVVYSDNAQNSYVSDGKLYVKPTLLSDSGVDIREGTLELSGCTEGQGIKCSKTAAAWNILPPIQSARLTTKQTFSFRYGRVEMRAKVPAGDWIFPEFWLEPKSNTYGTNAFESGRIQMALVRGNRNLELNGKNIGSKHLEAGCMIGTQNSMHSDTFSNDSTSAWTDGFHSYSIVWTPAHITFSVDKTEIGKIVPPNDGFGTLPEFSSLQSVPWSSGTKIAPFDQEFYLNIGLGVGGMLQFPDNCLSNNHPKPWKNRSNKAMLSFWQDKDNWYPTWHGKAATLEVSHIKVWAL